MILRIRYERLGDHVHASVWMGETEGSLGKCGTLVMHIGEWQLFDAALSMGAKQTHGQLTFESVGTLNP